MIKHNAVVALSVGLSILAIHGADHIDWGADHIDWGAMDGVCVANASVSEGTDDYDYLIKLGWIPPTPDGTFDYWYYCDI